MNKKIVFGIKIAITLVILLVLFKKVGVEQVFKNLANISLALFIPLMIFEILTLLLGALNIFVLVRRLKPGMRFATILRYYLMTWSLSLFTPGRLSDISTVYFLKKEKIDAGKGTVVVLLDNLITLIVVGIFSLFGIYAFRNHIDFMDNTLPLAVLFALITISAVYVLTSQKWRSLIAKYILRKKALLFKGFGKGANQLIKENKGAVVQNILITIIKMFCIYMVYYMGFLMIGTPVDYLNIIKVVPLARLISLVPITINGIGIKEGMAVYLFGFLGVTGSIVLSASIMLLIVTYLTGALAVITTITWKEPRTRSG